MSPGAGAAPEGAAASPAAAGLRLASWGLGVPSLGPGGSDWAHPSRNRASRLGQGGFHGLRRAFHPPPLAAICRRRCPDLQLTLLFPCPLKSNRLTIMLFMAVTSTGSAELIAVSALFSYDFYR